MRKCFNRGKCEIEVKKSFIVNVKLRLFHRYLIHYNLRLKDRASRKRFSNLFARVSSSSLNTSRARTLRDTTLKKGVVMDVEGIPPNSVSR